MNDFFLKKEWPTVFYALLINLPQLPLIIRIPSQPIRLGLSLYLPLHIPKFPFLSIPKGQLADLSRGEDLHSFSGSNVSPTLAPIPTFGLFKTVKTEICQAIKKYQLSESRNRISDRRTITVNTEGKKKKVQLSFICNETDAGQCFAFLEHMWDEWFIES